MKETETGTTHISSCALFVCLFRHFDIAECKKHRSLHVTMILLDVWGLYNKSINSLSLGDFIKCNLPLIQDRNDCNLEKYLLAGQVRRQYILETPMHAINNK